MPLAQQYPAAMAKLLLAIDCHEDPDPAWDYCGKELIDQLIATDCVPKRDKDQLEELSIQLALLK